MSSSSFSPVRVIKGCRILFAPLKSSSSPATAAATTATSKSKPKQKTTSQNPGSRSSSSPKPRREFTRPTGILKVAPVSPALHSFLGIPEVSRAQAVKQVWTYIKQHNLQNPADGREIKCDEKLKSIFEGRDKVGFLEIGKLLFRHFQKY